LAAFGKAAGIFRDWVGIPTAVATLVTAFFYPAVGTVLGWFHWDRASVSVTLFNTDVINIGSDDRAAFSRVDKIIAYERILRGQLVNNGFSTASLNSNFRCAGQNVKNGRMVYTFAFYDPRQQIKIFPELAARATLSFFGRLTGAGVYLEKDALSAPGPKQCTFDYFDKYGFRYQPSILNISDSQVKEIDDLSREDESVDWPEQYCKGMVTKMRLADKVTADCVSGSHVIALEPSYSWNMALSRALSDAKSFMELTKSQAQRTPGIVLVCTKYSDCGEDKKQTIEALSNLGIPSTAWWCGDGRSGLKDCERLDFPLNKG
jgi:hypothetical protein